MLMDRKARKSIIEIQTLALAHGNNMPREKSPSETPPVIPLKERASCRTGPNRSTANTNINDKAPQIRHTHRAICQRNIKLTYQYFLHVL